MAHSDRLRELRTDTVINTESKVQEKTFSQVVKEVVEEVSQEYQIELHWQKRLYLKEIAKVVPDGYYEKETSFLNPDGGIVGVKTKYEDTLLPIFIGEVKKQGTNNKRLAEGKKKQAQGNAIERLGKNLSGFQTWLWREGIFPFVCFGYGCDFAEGSSIRDRVITMNGLRPLNTINVIKDGRPTGGSMFFREEEWTEEEMKTIIKEVMVVSLTYYKEKYDI